MDRGVRAIVSHRLPNAEELEAGCGDWIECCQAYIHKQGCAATKATPHTDDQLEPRIKSGGESLSIYEIMQRFRNDGSCEHIIEQALTNLSRRPADGVAPTVDKDKCACGHDRWDHWGWGNFACVHGDCSKFTPATTAAPVEQSNKENRSE